MRLKNFCVPFQWGYLFYIMCEWKQHLGEEFQLLSDFLLPTNDLAPRHPGNAASIWQEMKVQVKPNGQIIGAIDRSKLRVELAKADILIHKFDLRRFRKEMCENFGLIPQSGEIDQYERTVPWGFWEPEKGARFPITLFMGLYGRSLRDRLMEVALNRETAGEIILTANRREWKGDVPDIARRHNLLLVPFDEIIQMEDGKLLPTPEWDEYLTAFCKMVEMDLPSQFQRKAPEFMLAKRGAWVFRFDKKETIAGADWPGPAFVQFLLQNPGAEFHVEKLWQAVMGSPSGTHFEHAFADDGIAMPESLLGGADEVLDAEAKAAYEKRLRELSEERQKAKADRDAATLERIEVEFEAIRTTLESSGGGLHRPKKLGDPSVKLRDRIRRGINVFLDHVSDHDPEGGQYLRNTIKKGVFMQYSPSRKIDWNLS